MTFRLSALALALAATLGVGPLTTCARAANHGFPVDWDRSHAGAPLSLEGYARVFDDEFDTLRLTPDGGAGPWYAPIHTAMGMGDLMAPPDPAYAVAHGKLVLSTRLEDRRWREANLQTTDSKGAGFALQNGYFEARMALPKAHGAHAGLWLVSQNDYDRGHVEFDIVESYGAGGGAGHHATSHVWPGHQGVARHVFTSNITPVPTLLDGFHSFGALATDELFIVYYDRREIARIARQPQQRAPMHVLVSLFENKGDPPIEPATMQVDWVRVYAPPAGR